RKFGEPWSARMDAIQPFAPDALAAALAAAADELHATAVFAAGTERGNEVMARLAARMDLPFAANCIAATPGDPVVVTRLRWGGSTPTRSARPAPRSRRRSTSPAASRARRSTWPDSKGPSELWPSTQIPRPR